MSAPTIVFDLDGTLVDTAPDLARTMNELLSRHGRDALPAASVRSMVGAGARALMEKAFERTGAPASDALLDQLYLDFLEHYIASIDELSEPYPGVVATLEALKREGAGLAVCTNKPEVASHRLLAALDLDRFFEAVLGGDSLPVRKPHPDHILEAVRRSGGRGERAVMIGDTLNDIEAARNARVPVIAVTYGYSDPPVAAHGPDHLIDEFGQLPALLAELGFAGPGR